MNVEPKRGTRNNTEGIAMATMLDLKPPPPIRLMQTMRVPREPNAGKMARRLNYVYDSANIKDGAVLLYIVGPFVHKIFKTLQDTRTNFKTALEKLGEYPHPTPGESVDSYVTRLRTQAETCEFGSAGNHIRDQLVMTCSSNAFRTKLLRAKDLTLAKLITWRKRRNTKKNKHQERIHEYKKEFESQTQGRSEGSRQRGQFAWAPGLWGGGGGGNTIGKNIAVRANNLNDL